MDKKRCARCDALAVLSQEAMCLGCHEDLDGRPDPRGAAYWAEMRATMGGTEDARRLQEDDVMQAWPDDEGGPN